GLPGRITKAAATGSSRLIPRLPHRPRASRKPSGWLVGSVRVSGASRPTAVEAAVLTDVLMSLSLRRHYPVRFKRSAADSAALSARFPELPLHNWSHCSPSSGPE